MDPRLVYVGSKETLSPQPSDVGSLDPFEDEQNEEALHEEGSVDLADSRTLNFVGATIRDTSYPGDGGMLEPRGAPSIVLPHQEATYVRHIALDIGGSLIKLVYFSPDPEADAAAAASSSSSSSSSSSDGAGPSGSGGAAAGAADAAAGKAERLPRSHHTQQHPKGGRIHFVKFETARIADCLDFIEAKGLHRCLGRDGFQHEMRVKATGGGAHRFADMFKERLGLVIEKEDEISCAVGGCNFLLRAISHEAFTFTSGQSNFLTFPSDSDLYPYLLVNIGSGVSIIKVDGDGQFTRISGSSVGGGTFWGLCSLLTGERDFDKILALSATGNNATVWTLLVGDIYGGRDYASIGLSATTIASSFGKVVGRRQGAGGLQQGDIAMALCRMISYNIGQLAYMNAKRFGLKRGEINALFLRHEGFLGAVGAFLKQPNL
ncbi:MAG: pantothenate kinase 2-like protein [Monoraphidium minutum]|nr:MAG: pantothenate kinase 2-like protein [Monoraphidium minutum]